MRRNKNDMELMKNECVCYLLQTNNNPHKAYDLFVKDYLESAQTSRIVAMSFCEPRS